MIIVLMICGYGEDCDRKGEIFYWVNFRNVRIVGENWLKFFWLCFLKRCDGFKVVCYCWYGNIWSWSNVGRGILFYWEGV